MLQEGMTAPLFTLPDSDGNMISLSDFLGKKVVIYFYPRDNTPGCTNQACGFRDLHSEFKDTVIIGISKDSTASHKKFADKFNLPFILLSDTQLSVIKEYDVWKEKTMYGKTALSIARTTFIVDEGGKILKIFDKVKAALNPAEVLEFINNPI